MQLSFLHILHCAAGFLLSLLMAKLLGPAEFGRYAYILSLALILQSMGFGWLQLSATRFYSEKTRECEPQVRSSINLGYLISVTVLCCLFLLFVLLRIDIGFSSMLIWLCILISFADGFFQICIALTRSRFDNRLYATIILSKHILSYTLILACAFFFPNSTVTLLCVFLCCLLPPLFLYNQLRDVNASRREASLERIKIFAFYAFPIVIATFIESLSPLIYRSFIHDAFGAIILGQYMLAYELGHRIITAIASSIDISLFQLAVFKREQLGAEEAKRQLQYNSVILLLILLPVCLGFWLVLPSFVEIFVPVEFKSAVLQYMSILLPGFFLWITTGNALVPVFRMSKKTYPLIISTSIGCIANLFLVYGFSHITNPTSLAVIQMISLAFNAFILVGFAIREKALFPKIRDFVEIFGSALVMFLLVYPMRSWPPSLLTLFYQITTGCLSYSIMILILDTGQLRTGFLVPYFKNYMLSVRDQAAKEDFDALR